MPRPNRRWLAVGALVLATASIGLGAAPGADAQESTSDPSDAFGGFTASGRANGLQLTYNVENVFPLPAPLFQASVPEAAATMQSGPTSTALGSVAYPGNVLASLPAIVAQADAQAGQFVPPYPVLARAEHPAGPPEARQDIATASSNVRANDTFSESVTTMAGSDLPPFVRMGTVTTSARTGFVDGKLESRSRVEVAGLDLLYGLLHIESIVTDLVATTDGATAASAGGTTIGGMTFLGVPVTIGPDGILVAEPSAPTDAGAMQPVVDNLGDLGPVADGLRGALEPLGQALADVLGTTDASINDLLAATGIRIQLLEPFESIDGAAGERTANGLVVDITYDGQGDNPLAQLLAAIPSESLPGESLHPQMPINTSPQALVNLLKETHVTGFAIAYGNVSVNGSPAFEFEAPDFDPPSNVNTGGFSGAPSSFPTTNFGTPSPQLPPSTGGGDSVLDASPAGVAGAGAGAAAVTLALLSSPLWAIGSRKLADNALYAVGSSCPDGLDLPPKGG